MAKKTRKEIISDSIDTQENQIIAIELGIEYMKYNLETLKGLPEDIIAAYKVKMDGEEKKLNDAKSLLTFLKGL